MEAHQLLSQAAEIFESLVQDRDDGQQVFLAIELLQEFGQNFDRAFAVEILEIQEEANEVYLERYARMARKIREYLAR